MKQNSPTISTFSISAKSIFTTKTMVLPSEFTSVKYSSPAPLLKETIQLPIIGAPNHYTSSVPSYTVMINSMSPASNYNVENQMTSRINHTSSVRYTPSPTPDIGSSLSNYNPDDRMASTINLRSSTKRSSSFIGYSSLIAVSNSLSDQPLSTTYHTQSIVKYVPSDVVPKSSKKKSMQSMTDRPSKMIGDTPSVSVDNSVPSRQRTVISARTKGIAKYSETGTIAESFDTSISLSSTKVRFCVVFVDLKVFVAHLFRDS